MVRHDRHPGWVLAEPSPSHGGGLEGVEVVGGFLGVGSGLEDRPLVVLQDFQPVAEVGGVIARGSGVMPRSAQRNAAPISATSSSRA